MFRTRSLITVVVVLETRGQTFTMSVSGRTFARQVGVTIMGTRQSSAVLTGRTHFPDSAERNITGSTVTGTRTLFVRHKRLVLTSARVPRLGKFLVTSLLIIYKRKATRYSFMDTRTIIVIPEKHSRVPATGTTSSLPTALPPRLLKNSAAVNTFSITGRNRSDRPPKVSAQRLLKSLTKGSSSETS